MPHRYQTLAPTGFLDCDTESLRERDSFDDLPLEAMFTTFDDIYPAMAVSSGASDPAFHG